MIHIALLSEYSFGISYSKVKDLVKLEGDYIGIADKNNTFAHVYLEKECKAIGKKPIFGVRLQVCSNLTERFDYHSFETILIAKNNDGLKEINYLTSMVWEQFYYTPRLSVDQWQGISKNIIAIDAYSELKPLNFTNDGNIYVDCNNYINLRDRDIYQIVAGSSKRGEDRNFNFETSVHPQHVLSEREAQAYFGQEPVAYTDIIANQCNAAITKAEMVRFDGIKDLYGICIDSYKYKSEYAERLEYELGLIKSKGYEDYFLIVSDMIKYAKKNGILVGPSRGSSAGSLVCYLMDITEINPIEHNLLFERFIDINRSDLPDIDVDFPDDSRSLVIEYLSQKYGSSNVRALANINRFKPKSAISEFAYALNIPKYLTEDVKNSIVERSGGDARSSNTLEDTLEDTEAGKTFIERYPVMRLCYEVEGLANHAGKHAAGIIVSNKPLNNFASVDSRAGIIQLDKKGADYVGLLKIDALGLRTLTILSEICDSIGMSINDLYGLDLGDSLTYQLFADMRLNGIFQFEGAALRNIVKQIGAECFNDLALITALSRPGALNSGGTGRYIEIKKGNKEPIYLSEKHKEITEESLGVVVYQEQMMSICREIGRMSWEDVNSLRHAASRSLGDAFFAQYKDKFIEGCMVEFSKEDATALWENINKSGSWLFNKSHAVSYAVVSYCTAYFKANYPKEFAIANLNHVADEQAGVSLLRDLVENDGMKYKAVDPDESDVFWTIKDGILLGGLINIDGIGVSKAKGIVKNRKTGKMTPGLMKKLMNPVTIYDSLYPIRDKFAYLQKNNITLIRDIKIKGKYELIAMVQTLDVRDCNDYQSLARRDNKRVDGNSLYLRFIFMDDSDSIIGLINYKNYVQMQGDIIKETAIPGTYVYIRANLDSESWMTLNVNYLEILK
jgi:DNA-directed DNA polymerase III PolC